MNTDFEIIYKEDNGKHFMTFKPKKKGSNFLPKQIEITLEQWNELRYHFATGVDDVNKELILAYVM